MLLQAKHGTISPQVVPANAGTHSP